jgi:hypothetical protein
MKPLKGACIFGQSGGPTAVINASAAGVLVCCQHHIPDWQSPAPTSFTNLNKVVPLPYVQFCCLYNPWYYEHF